MSRIPWFLLVLGAPMYAAPFALGQHRHDGDVGRFYETWQRPHIRKADGARYSSCCSKADCGPVQIVIRNGATYVKGHFLRPNEEVHFPDYLHEHNHPDARESPDGRNHACMNPHGLPLCLVLGSQF
jgi:hypothetical protein